MKKTAVLRHFGDSETKVAEALGISKQAVNAWPEIVPRGSAFELHVITNGALRADKRVYDRLRQQQRA